MLNCSNDTKNMVKINKTQGFTEFLQKIRVLFKRLIKHVIQTLSLYSANLLVYVILNVEKKILLKQENKDSIFIANMTLIKRTP